MDRNRVKGEKSSRRPQSPFRRFGNALRTPLGRRSWPQRFVPFPDRSFAGSALMRRLFIFLSLLTTVASARENAYDVVGKVLTPLGQVLAQSSKTPNRAISVTFRAEGATASQQAATAGAVRVALEMPDHLRVTAPFEGGEITICRTGQKIWAF